MTDFTTKINSLRPYLKKTLNPSELKQKALDTLDIKKLQIQLESDRGRIITSAALRRLQQKTQVFPLERNAAVRSRLTHSLEVQQNGRYIVKKIFEKLEDSELVGKYKLVGLNVSIESIVEMACLMHDIGNPPFGHFGEKALIEWYKNNIEYLSDCNIGKVDIDSNLKNKITTDLQSFEGNAQAIRLIYSLQNLNLTFVQSACILKYTRPAWILGDKTKDSYLKKKAGYYLSEKDFINNMQAALQMREGCRHPLTYIMEAADDIAYCFADIEDGVDKKILSVDELKQHVYRIFEHHKDIRGNLENKDFIDIWGKPKNFKEVVEFAYERYEKEDINKNSEFFVWLRVNLIHNLINHAAKRFIENINEIYEGTFEHALMEDNSPFHKVIQTFKEVGFKHIFNDKEVHTLEIKGFQIITGLLNHYKCLLTMPSVEFNKIINHKKSDYIYESRLIDRIGNKYIKSYNKALENKENKEPQNLLLWEFYFRNRMIQDHISGMNDQYALDEYRLLNVT